MERLIKKIIGPDPKESGSNEKLANGLGRRIRTTIIFVVIAGALGLAIIFAAVGD